MGGSGHHDDHHHVDRRTDDIPSLHPSLNAPAVTRILARAAAAKTPEYPTAEHMWPASVTGGALPMRLVGRFENERERLGPEFTDAERKWRIKWFKEQNLHPSEPYPVPALYYELRNPIRRFYQFPLNYLENGLLAPRIGKDWAFFFRQVIGKGSLIYLTTLLTWYAMKYHHHTWEGAWGVNVFATRAPILPGDPAYPVVDPRPTPEDYQDCGFRGRKVFRNL